MCELKVSFSARCGLLRQTYGLSAMELSNLLGFKYASTVSEFEKGKNLPSSETLVKLANIFSVSIDWLTGRSNIIYTKASISAGEQAVSLEIRDVAVKFKSYQYINEYINAFNMYLEKKAPHYVYPEYRELEYPYSIRANISVLMRLVEIPNLYWSMYYDENGHKKSGVLDKVKKALHLDEDIEYKGPNKKELTRSENLSKLLTQQVKVPAYDVEENFKELSGQAVLLD